MSQIDLVSKLAATYVGIESVFGSQTSAGVVTPPTMTRAFPEEGSTFSIEQDLVANNDERTRGWQHVDGVLGLKRGTAKLVAKLRPDTIQLNAAATAAT